MTAGDRPAVTAVVCTLGRAPMLGQAVERLLEQSEPAANVLVIDNDPHSGCTASQLAAFDGHDRLRIVAEACRGLSVARNAAVAHVRTPLVAFTDDDALADRRWIERLVDVFAIAGDDLVCTTGRVVPTGSTNEAQRWFEEGFSFDKGTAPLVWRYPDPVDKSTFERLRAAVPDLEHGPRGPVFPIAAGEFGSGNNMAFRTEWLASVGGFDEALGAGSASRGGEDLDIFRRVMLDGGTLVYQPAAVVEHHHRDNTDDLVAQSFAYGAGMAANVTRYAMTSPTAALRALLGVPAALRLLARPDSPKNAAKGRDYPRRLDRAEWAGYAAGPFLALRATQQMRRARRPSSRPTRTASR